MSNEPQPSECPQLVRSLASPSPHRLAQSARSAFQHRREHRTLLATHRVGHVVASAGYLAGAGGLPLMQADGVASEHAAHHWPHEQEGATAMADIRSHDPLGRSDGGPASGRGGGSSSGGGAADQARQALRDASDRASDAWDSASEYGSRYYRQGSRAVGNVDTTTMTGFLVAGAIGFGLGWLVFGQHSYSGDYVARRMSRSSERDY